MVPGVARCMNRSHLDLSIKYFQSLVISQLLIALRYPLVATAVDFHIRIRLPEPIVMAAVVPVLVRREDALDVWGRDLKSNQ